MRRLFAVILILAVSLSAGDTAIFLFGDPSADVSIYLNTASAEKKLEPHLYAEMMSAAKKARGASKMEGELPITLLGRNWEVVANVHILPGKFTFLVDGMAQVAGGFQKELESLARVLGGNCQISDIDLEGITAKRFILNAQTVKTDLGGKAADDEDEEETEPDQEDEKLRSLDVLVTPYQGERFQLNGGCNAPLPMDALTLAKAKEGNIFLHEDLTLAAYFNIPKLLPLLPNAADNPQAAMLKGFLQNLSHVVISFQPDGMDLVLRIRMAFKTEELAQTMKDSLEQAAKAWTQSMSAFIGFHGTSCGVQGKFCDISGRVDLKEASAKLGKIMQK